MPIYMDRHDVSELVTAENVAQLHKEDLKIQHQFNCRGLTYWFDEIKKIAFCLVDAPDKESILQMHSHAHGDVPTQIIEIDATIVESFLGRIKDPEHSSQDQLNIINDPAQRTLMAIRFTTISLKGVHFSQSGVTLQQTIFAFGDILKHFEGRIVKQGESYLLVAFKTVSKAVVCALDVVKTFNSPKSKFGTSNRDLIIGLATGMPVNKDKDFFEDTIKLADCLCFVKDHAMVVSNEVESSFLMENPDNSSQMNKLFCLTLADESFLITLMELIEKEWQNAALTVNDFGRSLGMSKSVLYKKMMSLTGKSPNNFIREYRLIRSLSDINQKLKTISEIAFENGFNSTSYFSKCFKKRFELLPSEYIRS